MGYRLDIAYGELLNQFRDSPRFLSLIDGIFNRVEDTDDLLADLLTKRDLETASGYWLDIIGEILGFRRPTEFVPGDQTFQFKELETDPDDPDEGFADGPPITVGGYFGDVDGIHFPEAPLVDDDEYRTLLKAKARATNASPSLPSIGRFITDAFSVGFTITVPARNYIVIELDAGTDSLIQYAIKRFAPVAGGVNLYVI